MRHNPLRRGGVKFPKASKTIRIPGEGHKGAAQYKCWHCGFTCNEHRDALGGESSRSGVAHLDYTIEAPGAEPGVKESAYAILGGILHTIVAVQIDSDGNPRTSVHSHTVTGSGCPHCHTLNWRGDY